MDTTNVYNRGTFMPSQVGNFAYVIPSTSGGKGYIICINLVLPMGWVNSPIIFCAFLERLIDVTNALVDTDLLVLSYSKVSDIPATRMGPLHTPQILTILISVCMTSYQKCMGTYISNTESLMAQSVPPSGSSRHYRGISKTRCV